MSNEMTGTEQALNKKIRQTVRTLGRRVSETFGSMASRR
jgi:hypothetical protein